MAIASPDLITALRKTAWLLRTSTTYQWGHLGACNCGHLAQTLTDLSKAEIHSAALQRGGDWGEIVIDHCPHSGFPIDFIINKMLDVGLSKLDIEHLEDLDDPAILAKIPDGRRWLRRNSREDVILYMGLWADLLEEALPSDTETPIKQASEAA